RVSLLTLLLRPDQEEIKGREDDQHRQQEAERICLWRRLCVCVADEKVHASRLCRRRPASRVARYYGIEQWTWGPRARFQDSSQRRYDSRRHRRWGCPWRKYSGPKGAIPPGTAPPAMPFSQVGALLHS